MVAKVPESEEPAILLFRSADGKTRIQVRMQGETVWLTQLQLAELFLTSKQNISLHIRNILLENELAEDSVVKYFLTTAADGKRYKTTHYNLDMILAVGYRVRSQRGIQFRQWATERLREYLVKGFTLDDRRLKESDREDYFEELLERIRDIRASERRFYQKITDIYATSVDYSPNAEVTHTFFATVQNKLHFAIHGRTAAEVIHDRASAGKANMGLTTWKNAPDGPIRKGDVEIAKNYLNAEELSELNRIVTMYLDYAELQARQRKPMHMADWIGKLDAFLRFNEQNLLGHAGSVSHSLALEHAHQQFEQYQAHRRKVESEAVSSDFDRFVEQSKELKKIAPPHRGTAKKKRKKE